MPQLFSKPIPVDASETEIAFQFAFGQVELSLPAATYEHFDVPADSEGKRFSTEQLLSEIADLVRPYGIGTKWCKNVLLLALLTTRGCSYEQLKAVMVWMCVIFAIDDVFDGERFNSKDMLLAIAEAVLPKYDETGLPIELTSRINSEGMTVVDTTNYLRRNVVYPLLKSRRSTFDASFVYYMQGVVDELLGIDATHDEEEYLRIRLADAGVLQFLELDWDFHGATQADVEAIARVSHLGQIMVGIDNDIVSHEKTVKERRGEAVHDFVTFHGGMNAARVRRDELYAEYRAELSRVQETNPALVGVVDWVSGNILFSASTKRYIQNLINVRHFFSPEVASWLVAERLIA